MISACGYLEADGVACSLHGRHRPDGRTAKPDLCFEWPPKNRGLHPGCVFGPRRRRRAAERERKCASNGEVGRPSGDPASPAVQRRPRSRDTSGGSVTDDLEQLYQSTYTAVVRFLYRKVWDAERAEDLAQEVFVRALSHRPEKPRAWVFAVAANLARDEARAAMRRKRHLTLLKGDPIAQPTMTPAADDTVEHDEQMASVQEALNTLTPAGPRDPAALGCGAELSGDRGADGPGGRRGGHDAGSGAPPAGRRARSAADPNGDRCGTFLRTSCTPIWTRG